MENVTKFMKDFYNFGDKNNYNDNYFLMPVAIIPFGTGRFTMRKKKILNFHEKERLNESLLTAMDYMKLYDNIECKYCEINKARNNDKQLYSLFEKFIYMVEFNYNDYNIIVFIKNIDELIFVVKKEVPFTNNNIKVLYKNWLKEKYNYIKRELISVLQLFYAYLKNEFRFVFDQSLYDKNIYNYSFYILYTNDNSKDYNYINAVLDPSRIFYSNDNSIELSDEIIQARINKLNRSKPVNIEKRSEYEVYFSWSTGLMKGNFSAKEVFELILIECDLQSKWNGINKKTENIKNKRLKIFVFYELELAKLEIFTANLNSLGDVSDSERLFNLKDKIINSSKIYILINEFKNLQSLNLQFNSKFISILALVVSTIALLTTIIIAIISNLK